MHELVALEVRTAKRDALAAFNEALQGIGAELGVHERFEAAESALEDLATVDQSGDEHAALTRRLVQARKKIIKALLASAKKFARAKKFDDARDWLGEAELVLPGDRSIAKAHAQLERQEAAEAERAAARQRKAVREACIEWCVASGGRNCAAGCAASGY